MIGAVATTRHDTTRQRNHLQDGSGAEKKAGGANNADDGKDDNGENPIAVGKGTCANILELAQTWHIYATDHIFCRTRASHGKSSMLPFPCPDSGWFYLGKWKCAPWRSDEGMWHIPFFPVLGEIES